MRALCASIGRQKRAAFCLTALNMNEKNIRLRTALHRPIFWLLLAAAVAVLDQWAKWGVVQSDLTQGAMALAPFLRLVYAENTGSAFSFLAGQGEWARWLLVALASVLSVMLAVWLFRRPPLLESAAVSLVLGGALGNLIDRIRLGYVIDYIDVHAGKYHWPAFNVADSAITLGVILLLWSTFVRTEKPSADS